MTDCSQENLPDRPESSREEIKVILLEDGKE